MAEYEIVLKPAAVADLDRLRKYDAAMIADGIRQFLTHNPRRESKSRIKRLCGLHDPDYRLRLGAYRVFYNVDDAAKRVDVLRVLHKDKTRGYYEETPP